MKILTIVGARPQFIKAAMVSHAIAAHNRTHPGQAIVEEMIHTGQHYDKNMSDVFFRDMAVPEPVMNMQVGSGRHAVMTGKMLALAEEEILGRSPDLVLVYGDTNSTLAGALAAAKLNVPVAHVEAGLRSFNRAMPEEINRVLTDHVSALLLCPTRMSVKNLAREGIENGVHRVGDVMYDAALTFGEIARKRSTILSGLDLEPGMFALATVHRAENTDRPDRLAGILDALAGLAADMPVVFPAHPRTRKCVAEHGLEQVCRDVRMIEPVSFLDMVRLEQDARVVLTDSGGVQKEAYFHGVPCVTLRDETEWVETLEHGWNVLTGSNADAIVKAARNATPGSEMDEYGDGNAAGKIVEILLQCHGC